MWKNGFYTWQEISSKTNDDCSNKRCKDTSRPNEKAPGALVFIG